VNPTHLVLFDIDGTLLTTHRRGWENPFKEAIEGACLEEGMSVIIDTSKYRPGGKTDPQIIYELLGGASVPEETIAKVLPRIQKKYIKGLKETVRGPEHVDLKPGVLELLRELKTMENLILGLLTGNFEEGARVKLGTHGLNDYFPFGAFGDGARQRSELPQRAVEEAKKRFGREFKEKEIILIGDTPNDVRCGRHLNVRSIAVATSTFTLEDLKAENPDYLFPNLTDTKKVISAILGPT
jgi:phosphoglycolate phosphatase